MKALVPVGAAAALAAAFNTPIAAVLFTLEEVMGDMHAPVLGSVVLSSATSWMVLHLLLGDEPLFHVPAYELKSPLEFITYAVLGVVGGLVSVAFVKMLLWQRRWFQKLPTSTRWFQPVFGGIVVGLLGWFVPDVLGVGYGSVGQALNGHILLGTMALLVVLKLIATTTCYSSGNAGGIFGPSLFIGAMLGGAVGSVAHMVMPRTPVMSAPMHWSAWGRVRRHHPRAFDFGHHDLRSDARLHHHRAADDRQPARLLHIEPAAGRAHLRIAAPSGWYPPSVGGWRARQGSNCYTSATDCAPAANPCP